PTTSAIDGRLSTSSLKRCVGRGATWKVSFSGKCAFPLFDLRPAIPLYSHSPHSRPRAALQLPNSSRKFYGDGYLEWQQAPVGLGVNTLTVTLPSAVSAIGFDTMPSYLVRQTSIPLWPMGKPSRRRPARRVLYFLD